MEPRPSLKNPFKTRIGFALGGGGARGVGHIGVLKAMSQSDHRIDCIAGTSSGALIAALYAFGRSPAQILQVFSSLSLTQLGFFTFGRSGILDGKGVAELVKKELGDVDISDAKIPLAIVCTDLKSGRNVVLTEGPLALLVQASAALPGLFHPVEYQGMLLVDGFLTENVPVSAVRQLGANFIVAVSLSARSYQVPDKLGIKDSVNRAFDILVDRSFNTSMSRVAYAINLDMSFVERFKVSNVERAVELGYHHTQVMLRKPLSYWYFRPILVYVRGIQGAFRRLARSFVSRPNLRLPGFRSFLSRKTSGQPTGLTEGSSGE